MYPPPEIPRISAVRRLASFVGRLFDIAVAPLLLPGAHVAEIVGTRRNMRVWDRTIDI